MKKLNLDLIIGDKIKLNGEVPESFMVRAGVTVTFAEGATFNGQLIKSGQCLYNDGDLPRRLSISSLGTLSLISLEEIVAKARAEAKKEAIAQIKAEAEKETVEEIAKEERLIAKIRIEAIKEVIWLSAGVVLLRDAEGGQKEVEESSVLGSLPIYHNLYG